MIPKQNSTNKHPSHKQASDKQSSKQTSDKQPSLVKKKKTQQILTTPITNNGTCLLSGILEEEHDGSEFLQSINHDSDSYRDGDDNEDSLMDALEDTKKQRMTTSPNTVGQYSGINQSPPQGDQSNYDDEDSECNIMNSVIEPIPINVEDRIQPDDSTKIAEDDEKDYLGEEWQWNNWEEHDIDTEIEGPKEDDHYSGPCGLTSGVSKKFVTVVPIHQFNFMARKKFHLAPNASFDEGSIPMRSCFCPARQYNKDKAAKYRVDFFICYGCRYLFMDNRYAAPQLLALMLTNYNIRAVGTCEASRKGFDSDALQLPKDEVRGDFKCLHDKRLGIVITRWKDSKKLQTGITVMKYGTQVVQRRNGANIIDTACSNNIVLYQQNMGGVDRGDHHRMIGTGFSNVASF